MLKSALALLVLAAVTAGCGPATARPVSFPDPEVSCPGGKITWGLEIRDQRADREAGDQMEASIRDAIQKSFPGCRWSGGETSEGGVIAVEVHRFVSVFDGVAWEAAVEWTVTARDGGGRTLTEFAANEEVSRPNYRGTDNEQQSLSDAFRQAIERTTKGLAAIPRTVGSRPLPGTPENRAAASPPHGISRKSLTPNDFVGSEGTGLRARVVERISQCSTAEDL